INLAAAAEERIAVLGPLAVVVRPSMIGVDFGDLLVRILAVPLAAPPVGMAMTAAGRILLLGLAFSVVQANGFRMVGRRVSPGVLLAAVAPTVAIGCRRVIICRVGVVVVVVD